MIAEKQKFTNKWLWLFLITVNGLTLYAVIQQLIFKTPVGSNPAPDLIVIMAFVTTFLILVLFKMMYLQILIETKALTIVFYPFVKKVIPVQDIHHLEMVKYNSLTEYGGWGIRYGTKGWAYNIGGNLGLKIHLKNESILVGIKNEKQFQNLIDQYYRTSKTDRI